VDYALIELLLCVDYVPFFNCVNVWLMCHFSYDDVSPAVLFIML
jgi:hypothetical protein